MVDYSWVKGGLLEFVSRRTDTYYWGEEVKDRSSVRQKDKEMRLLVGEDMMIAFQQALKNRFLN